MCRSMLKKAALLMTVIVLASAVTASAASEDGHIESIAGDTGVLNDAYNIEIKSNRHTQPDPVSEPVENRLDTAGYTMMMENDNLEVWFRPEVAGIRVRVKETGYIWGGILDDKAPDLNKRWSAMANAFCTIEYFDWQNIAKSVSISDESVETVYTWREGGFDCDVNIPSIGISLTVSMDLCEDHIAFSVKGLPTEVPQWETVRKSIMNQQTDVLEEHFYRLKSVYFMPLLGTVREADIPGYMFVPDGSGALIRFRSAAKYLTNYEKKVYGKDYGIDSTSIIVSLDSNRPNDYVVDEPQVLMPVYGIAHGSQQHAFFAVIEDGDEYASILATVADPMMTYNWAAVRFDYRQIYNQPVNKRGSGVMVAQPDINVMTPRISFYFLSNKEADYAGMARLYKSILQRDGGLTATAPRDGDIPIRVDVMGADVKAGFLWNSVTAFTTVSQAMDIVDALRSNGIKYLNMTYQGWQKGGVNGAKNNQAGFESKLGSKSAFEQLRDKINENGHFYLGVSPVKMNKTQLNVYRNAATNMSKSHISFVRDSYSGSVLFDEYFLVHPQLAAANVRRIITKHPDFNIALDGLGYLLYSDYTNRSEISRGDAMYIDDDLKIGAYVTPNAYLWDTMEVFYDIPMSSSQYLFESDTVPFLQIVLRGSVEYFAPYANQGYNSINSLLKTLEYGACPSFILTGVESRFLKDTPQEELFTTYYVEWLPLIKELYETVNHVLSRVGSAEIVDHKALADGVAMTEYDEGTRVFVNYGTHDYYDEVYGVLIPAQGYAVQ